MIEYQNTLIRSYETMMRDVLNASALSVDMEKLTKQNKMFVDKMKELFKLQDSNSWVFITSSLDTLGDSHFAITSFLNNNIDNGKRFNTGERYLRLYGVLSSVYIHFRSISILAEVTKIKTGDLEDEYQELDIAFLRNAISAHPVNYNTETGKTSFKVARYSVSNPGMLVVAGGGESKTYDLRKSLDEYIVFSEITLESVLKKLICNRFDTAKDKRNELLEKVEEIKKRYN